MELILWFPVVLMFLCGVIEFGLILGQLKQVALASRLGARVAAEMSQAALPTAVGTVRTALERHLNSAGMTSCSVILTHNVPAVGGTTQTDGSCPGAGCSVPDTLPPLPNGTVLAGGGNSGSVRVTVCVPLTELSPDLLGTLGFSIGTRRATHTTTMAYEFQ
jgi:hypothetical protein